MLQDTIFSEGEGDAWFERNRGVYDAGQDPALRLLSAQSIRLRKVLEIGSSRGDRLAALHASYGSAVTGVEPSASAVTEGREIFPAIEFFVGTAGSLPLKDESFDLIITNGVFCWIDRKSLLVSAAEIDRVLRSNGHLLIGDFAPFSPKKVRYHHRADLELYTYKQDYSALFLGTAGYTLVAQQMVDHRSMRAGDDIPENERFGVTLLKKVAGGTYTSQAPPV
jgi:SAM-dependent methyltransferase